MSNELTRDERILAIVRAQHTRIEPSKINPGMVVVVNGITGLDACAPTADECFDDLLNEEDGHGSPGRIAFGFSPSGDPTLIVRQPAGLHQENSGEG